MSKPCAICWQTNETTWICERCRRSPANRDWVVTPPWEVYGVLTVDGEIDPTQIEYLKRLAEDPIDQSDVEFESSAGPFETPLCIEIMRQWCLGESRRAIAAATGAGRGHVDRTITYWRAERGEFLKRLLELLHGGTLSQPSVEE